ncbi:MAG: glycosyltransferase family 2 protein [Microcoleaceae cyanobacterium]
MNLGIDKKRLKITVGIPTYRRLDKIPKTLDKILSCNPQPEEIIIHVDGNDFETKAVLQEKYPTVKILTSETNLGPGGGRNRILEAASHPIVASFDDDSYPIDTDYFARLIDLFEQFPEAAVIHAAIFHQNETIKSDHKQASWVADFIGCGCAYRRDVFLETTGYIPLRFAYGMEEVDLSLRLHHLGWKILYSPWLRVFHNTELEHHGHSKITAASISNQALLAYLRYPVKLWGLGLAQVCSRVLWLIQHQRFRGIFSGLTAIPKALWNHRSRRQTVSDKSVQSFLEIRRNNFAVFFPIRSSETKLL